MLGALVSDVRSGSAALVGAVTVGAAVKVDHAILGVPAAELPLPAAIHAERRELPAARMGARVRPQVDHPVQGMPRAVLGFLLLAAAVVEAVARSGAAPRGQARLLLGADVDHVALGVPEAELRVVAAGHAEVRLGVAHGVAASPVGRSQYAPLGGRSGHADVRVRAAGAAAAAAAAAESASGAVAVAPSARHRHVRLAAGSMLNQAARLVSVTGVHHALLGMPGAKLRRLAAGHPEARLLGAARGPAPPARDVDHTVAGVSGAEHRLLAAANAVRRDHGATLPAAHLGPDVDHPGFGVPGAELCLLAAVHAVPRVRVAPRVAARLAAHVHHAWLGVPRAGLRLLGAVHTEPRLDGAARLVARLGTDVDHAVPRVSGAEFRLLAPPYAEVRAFGAFRLLAAPPPFLDDGVVTHSA